MGKDKDNFFNKLNKTYGVNSISRDAFGRREATPSEIARVIKPADNMNDGLIVHPPTEQDIKEKGDS